MKTSLVSSYERFSFLKELGILKTTQECVLVLTVGVAPVRMSFY